jgi:CheY-like chemotaxis protein
MRILVIEDSRFLRLAIERSFVKAGYDVTSVGDGQEGLRLAEQVCPDAILLDMMLPGLEGTTILRCLKENPVTREVPVAVLSGLSQRNEAKLKKAGAAIYVEKASLDLENDSGALIKAVQQLIPGAAGHTA